MKTATRLGVLLSTTGLLLSSTALAQDGEGASPEPVAPVPAEDGPAAAPNDGNLPTPKSDNDAQPEVATAGVPSGGIIKQAGVGGDTGYGRAGVLELGGSMSFRAGSGFTQASVAPSVGWFLADNFQISAMFDLGYVEQDDNSAMFTSLLVEPSYHIPFNRSMFGFLGIGLGGAHVEDLGLGFATAPRIGMNMLIGRSGVLSPSLSWQYTTHDADTTEGANANATTVAVSSAARFNVGYTVMW